MFRYAMGQLMRHHIKRNRETVKDFPVTIAKHPLFPIPEGVFISTTVVDGADER